jgi:hypothetical protein
LRSPQTHQRISRAKPRTIRPDVPFGEAEGIGIHGLRVAAAAALQTTEVGLSMEQLG